jgi:transcriptional regulator with XRE-family HTH domain
MLSLAAHIQGDYRDKSLNLKQSRASIGRVDLFRLRYTGRATMPARSTTLGDNLKRLREAAGLDQAALAAKAGYRRTQTISDLENGVIKHSTDKFLAPLAAALGTTVAVLRRVPNPHTGNAHAIAPSEPITDQNVESVLAEKIKIEPSEPSSAVVELPSAPSGATTTETLMSLASSPSRQALVGAVQQLLAHADDREIEMAFDGVWSVLTRVESRRKARGGLQRRRPSTR